MFSSRVSSLASCSFFALSSVVSIVQVFTFLFSASSFCFWYSASDFFISASFSALYRDIARFFSSSASLSLSW